MKSNQTTIKTINKQMKKEFNLEEALKGAKLVTRDGREVSEWKYFDTCKSHYNIVAIIDGEIRTFCRDDIFIFTEPKKCYVNVYRQGDGSMWLGEAQETLEDAKDNISKSMNYIKTIEITDEP